MGRRKKSVETDQDIRLRPTLSPEALENRQIFLANRLAEQKLLDGTASSQLIVHFLKLGTTRNQLEIEKLRAETAKANAQAESIKANERDGKLTEEAIKAFTLYRGKENEDESEIDDDDDEYY